MNRSQFNRFLDKPNAISEAQKQVLQGVLSEFPYFQSARVLYVKGLHNNQDISFSNELSTMSVYAGDRTKLHEVIHQTAPAAVPEVATAPAPVPAPREKAAKKNEASIDVILQSLEKSDPVDRQIIEEALSASSIYRLQEEHPEMEAPNTRELEELVPAIKPTPPPKPRPKQSLLDWIKPETSSEALPMQKFDELYKTFISKDKQRQEQKAQFFSPEELAKKSIEDKGDKLVTETLAQIYINQGNFEKALEIYNRLLAINPEKSLYFAVRIQNLERKIKEK